VRQVAPATRFPWRTSRDSIPRRSWLAERKQHACLYSKLIRILARADRPARSNRSGRSLPSVSMVKAADAR
jgi:hypothetical protein